MQGWMNDERIMIACCSDGTRPVIFKIERMDYKAVYINGIGCNKCRNKIKKALEQIEDVLNVVFRKKDTKNEYIELFIDKDISNDLIIHTIESLGKYQVTKID
jgi:copper chaperone CopZ